MVECLDACWAAHSVANSAVSSVAWMDRLSAGWLAVTTEMSSAALMGSVTVGWLGSDLVVVWGKMRALLMAVSSAVSSAVLTAVM